MIKSSTNLICVFHSDLSSYFFGKGKKCQNKAKKAILKIAKECFGEDASIDWEWHSTIEIPEFSIHSDSLTPVNVALYKIALNEWLTQLVYQRLLVINNKNRSPLFTSYYL